MGYFGPINATGDSAKSYYYRLAGGFQPYNAQWSFETKFKITASSTSNIVLGRCYMTNKYWWECGINYSTMKPYCKVAYNSTSGTTGNYSNLTALSLNTEYTIRWYKSGTGNAVLCSINGGSAQSVNITSYSINVNQCSSSSYIRFGQANVYFTGDIIVTGVRYGATGTKNTLTIAYESWDRSSTKSVGTLTGDSTVVGYGNSITYPAFSVTCNNRSTNGGFNAQTRTWNKGHATNTTTSSTWYKYFTTGETLDFPDFDAYYNDTAFGAGATAAVAANMMFIGWSTSTTYSVSRTSANPGTMGSANITLYSCLASIYGYNGSGDAGTTIYATVKTNAAPSAYYIAAAGIKIESGTSTSYGSNVVASSASGSTYNILPGKSTAGTQTNYIRFTANGYTKVGSLTVTVTASIITVTIPTVLGTYTYSGSVITASFNNYDTGVMTRSGTYSATAAGEYTATFTLKDTTGYKWSDGTTTPKPVTWTINRRSRMLTADEEMVATYPDEAWTKPSFSDIDKSAAPIASIVDGTLADVEVDIFTKEVIAIPKQKAGTTTITYTIPQTTNYEAASVTITLIVQLGGNIYVKVSGDWHRGLIYVNINGVWHSGTPYVKENNAWKEGI